MPIEALVLDIESDDCRDLTEKQEKTLNTSETKNSEALRRS